MDTIKEFKVSEKMSYHAGRTPKLGEEEIKDPDLLPVYKDAIMKSLNSIGKSEVTGDVDNQKKPPIFYLGVGMAVLFFTMWALFLGE